MSAVASSRSATSTTYRRATGALWRDTGLHVLVFRAEASSAPLVLGGGHAQLWRLLTDARPLSDLVSRFTASGSDEQDVAVAVSSALDALRSHGLLDETEPG